MQRNIFISYSREDAATVHQLADALTAGGHQVFFDQQVSGGQSWWHTLLDRIAGCDAFVPVLSARYLESVPCKEEARYAGALGRPFVPVNIEEISPALVDPRVAEAQWVAFRPGDPQSLLSLMRAFTVMSAAPPLPNPMPPQPAVPISYLTDLQEQVTGPVELTRDQQVALVARLRDRLGGPDDKDVRLLLSKLRGRPDLNVRVAEDIDALGVPRPLAPPTATGFAQPAPSAPRPAAPQPASQMPAPPTAPPIAPPIAPQTWGGPVGGGMPGSLAKPPNYLPWAIAATVLCCLPGGIVSIVYANQVDKFWAAGNVAGAQTASRNARTWLIISAVAGVVLGMVLVAASSGSNSNF
jgi:hypothetical protein